MSLTRIGCPGGCGNAIAFCGCDPHPAVKAFIEGGACYGISQALTVASSCIVTEFDVETRVRDHLKNLESQHDELKRLVKEYTKAKNLKAKHAIFYAWSNLQDFIARDNPKTSEVGK